MSGQGSSAFSPLWALKMGDKDAVQVGLLRHLHEGDRLLPFTRDYGVFENTGLSVLKLQ